MVPSTSSGASPTREILPQHASSFGLQPFPESEPLRSGAVEAVTLLAKAMAAMKETRLLENNIIKDV